MAAVDRGAPRSIASFEGIVRMVGAICWNNDRVEQAVVLFIPSIMSSHFASFSCRPKAEDMHFTDCRSESTWFVSSYCTIIQVPNVDFRRHGCYILVTGWLS